ncbi:hypothetical protein PENTCL1PPCAC_9952 [Pristionchus entomophagus]|uniref:BZIP domain-containing protein n=1 Tax=Pristionchus entomophagus TaxID=358040 RepID=A0AAV5SWR4_9BILA|nr:hypothetical protein PENTCL1PPCAC_9952 [Pristionchus entomophagus]
MYYNDRQVSDWNTDEANDFHAQTAVFNPTTMHWDAEEIDRLLAPAPMLHAYNGNCNEVTSTSPALVDNSGHFWPDNQLFVPFLSGSGRLATQAGDFDDGNWMKPGCASHSGPSGRTMLQGSDEGEKANVTDAPITDDSSYGTSTRFDNLPPPREYVYLTAAERADPEYQKKRISNYKAVRVCRKEAKEREAYILSRLYLLEKTVAQHRISIPDAAHFGMKTGLESQVFVPKPNELKKIRLM